MRKGLAKWLSNKNGGMKVGAAVKALAFMSPAHQTREVDALQTHGVLTQYQADIVFGKLARLTAEQRIKFGGETAASFDFSDVTTLPRMRSFVDGAIFRRVVDKAKAIQAAEEDLDRTIGAIAPVRRTEEDDLAEFDDRDEVSPLPDLFAAV